MLVEGSSIRSIERMRRLRCESIQTDEIWCYVGKKQKCVTPDDPAEFGDQFTFVAMDTDTKLVPCFVVGKRTQETTDAFMADLSDRINGRVQLTTDAFGAFRRAVRRSFNGRADYMQVVKTYASPPEHDTRYSPPTVVAIDRIWIQGSPRRRATTSHIERQNLTIRMQMRRFTRLTNAFSKKLENLEAALALHFAWYNFVRVHRTLSVTPAMAAGLVSTVWTISELIP